MTQAHIAPTGIMDLIAQSGPVAKLVLLALLAASVLCWAVIIAKWRAMKVASSQNEKFLNAFWHGKNIDEVVTKSEKYPASPVASVFRSGVKELRKLAEPGSTAVGAEKVENIQRALTRATASEIAQLERYVGWLATTASAAPFVGLFGTVWGIMNSFQSIGASGAANLAIVAPGISEALVTTATGIGAAIPAVIAYNYFVGQIKRVAVDMECFQQDFINIIQRSALGSSRKGG
jgi:biopolymer transport protein TolQ